MCRTDIRDYQYVAITKKRDLALEVIEKLIDLPYIRELSFRKEDINSWYDYVPTKNDEFKKKINDKRSKNGNMILYIF